MSSKDEPGRERDLDRAWRDIVDNYGDRAEVEDHPDDRAGDRAGDRDQPWPEQDDAPAPIASTPPVHEQRDDEERFVPPPPPPLPTVEPRRRAAWAGLFGAPLVLLTFTVLGWGMPALMAYALVAAFVGGFVYLVAAMPRGPRDPGDDGARV